MVTGHLWLIVAAVDSLQITVKRDLFIWSGRMQTQLANRRRRNEMGRKKK